MSDERIRIARRRSATAIASAASGPSSKASGDFAKLAAIASIISGGDSAVRFEIVDEHIDVRLSDRSRHRRSPSAGQCTARPNSNLFHVSDHPISPVRLLAPVPLVAFDIPDEYLSFGFCELVMAPILDLVCRDEGRDIVRGRSAIAVRTPGAFVGCCESQHLARAMPKYHAVETVGSIPASRFAFDFQRARSSRTSSSAAAARRWSPCQYSSSACVLGPTINGIPPAPQTMSSGCG